MTSQNGERVLFERLETPRLVPKVTLKENWHSQQQQHSRRTKPLEKGDRKGALGWSTRRFDHLHRVKSSQWNLGQTSSENTDTFSHAGAVKEEIAEKNTDVMERINIGSNKICTREDLAKENMMFSQESSQAIFDICNVELMELKNSRIQCSSCPHHVFKGTIMCACVTRSNAYSGQFNVCTQRDGQAHDHDQRTTHTHELAL